MKSLQIGRHRHPPSKEFRPLTVQLYDSNYHYDKKYQSDRNCVNVQRKRIFLQYLWERTAEMGPTLSS